VTGRLGEGGMGIVFKARHVLLNKIVAIKVLRSTHSQEAWERFVQEAQSASKLNHSNIVSITDFGVLPDNHAYLVMEYLEGRTLTQAIAGQPMGAIRALNIALQVARGLAAVHEAGIIHRDLKPDNVFLQDREGQRDQVKIMDFGVAKVETGNTSGRRLTAHGMVMGTAEYISPEQASGKTVDARCDQYALGCLLYEMLTGVQVFRAETPSLMMKAHVFETPIPPRQRRPEADIPETAEAITLRLLSKAPEARFANMNELADVLQHEIEGLMQAPLQGGTIGKQLARGLSGSVKMLLGVGFGVTVVGLILWALQPAKKPQVPPQPTEKKPVMGVGAPVVTAPKDTPRTPAPGSNRAAPGPTPPEPERPHPGRKQQPTAEERQRPRSRGAKREAREKEARAVPAPGPTAPTGPVKLRVQPVQPADITLTCGTDIQQLCNAGCTVTIPAGDGKCVASASGFASKPYPFALLHGLAKKGKPLRVSLIDLRDR
jgi:serine/threonine-protein kinase